MTPDGNVAQTFDTLEPLVTAPAIAADGSVWWHRTKPCTWLAKVGRERAIDSVIRGP